ncbi:hypothetical protein ABEF79_05945 [Acinetobacter sp. ANC 7454]|uniref:hypothetical protein n=1 Tax=Acinetobacter thermotolerans TaxID=3151487 RepID=UPI00325A5D47
MFLDETPLARVVRAVGGQVKAGDACGVSAAIVGRWIRQKHLPRTEYTGETDYATALANASQGRFTKEWILEECNPVNVKGKKKELVDG